LAISRKARNSANEFFLNFAARGWPLKLSEPIKCRAEQYWVRLL